MTTARPEKHTGTSTYLDFIRRGIRSFSKAAAAGDVDPEMLGQLRAIRAQLDATEAEVVMALRADAWSWQQIADELGMTKAGAYQRFVGRPGIADAPGARRPGAQPGHLR